MVLFKGFDRRLYGVGEHFTFCRFSRKRKFFGNFDCDFRKSFTIYEEFRNCCFDGKLSIFNYRQPLLSLKAVIFMGFENILIDRDVYRSIFASPENATLFG